MFWIKHFTKYEIMQNPTSSYQYFGNKVSHPLAGWILYISVWNAVTVLCGQLDCDDGHL